MKEFLIFSGGVIIGCVTTYFVLKDQFEEDLQEQIEDVKHAYAEAVDRIYADKYHTEDSEEESVEEADPTIEKSSIDEAKKELKSKVQYLAYNKIGASDADQEAESEDSSDVDPEAEFPQDDAPGVPYVISAQQFATEYPFFDKVTLEYYEHNGILVDEDGVHVEDIDETIGKDSLLRIGEYEPNVVYVRNEELNVDFEVCRIRRDFYASSSEEE
jgi:hypothetical protein